MTNEYSTVDCNEVDHTSKFSWSDTGFSASVTLTCAWGDRIALVKDLKQNRRPFPGLTGIQDPPKVVAADVIPQPTSAADATLPLTQQNSVYFDAYVSVRYEPDSTDPDTNAEDIYSESISSSGEFITEDFRPFRWGNPNGDALIEGEAPGRLIQNLTLQRTNFNQLTVPSALILAVGKVNDALYTSSIKWINFAFEPETLLLAQPQMQRSVSTDGGQNSWTVSMQFIWKKNGWNKFWRAKTKQFEEQFLAGGLAKKSYELADFTTFLKP